MKSFFEGVKEFIPYLKLEASYGLLGSHRGVSEFRYLGRLERINGIYNFGNTMGNAHGYVEDILANPGLTWEKSEQTNVGIEAKVFKNQLSLSAEYFRDNRTDMYVANNRISSLLGTVATVEENIGEMHTYGYDVAAFWNSKVGEFGYVLGGTFSYSHNLVTKLGEADQPYPWLQSAGYSKSGQKRLCCRGLFWIL